MKLSKKIFAILIFSIAMAYLESAIVVYLRLLYYPEGFIFPIKIIPDEIFLIELGRELATIFMLASISFLIGTRFVDRFSYFLFAFSVWDIFYYVWLKIFINWPDSLLTDDLLFLIPVPWISPVLAPIIVLIIFIILSITLLNFHSKEIRIKKSFLANILMILGVMLVLFSFVWDFQNRLNMTSPVEFLWMVYWLGIFLIVLGCVVLIRNSLIRLTSSISIPNKE
jgi:hypothetical protein